MDIGEQICIKSQKALEQLVYKSFYQLQDQEKDEIKKIIQLDRKLSAKLTSEILQEDNKLSYRPFDNLENLMKVIKEILPLGPMYYPKESISAYPERFIVSELIREKILYLTQEEIPHSVAVVVESMKKKNGNLYHIHASIVVDKDSKKGIIIGKGGQMLKQIGMSARKEIEGLLGIRVMLELFVKVEKDWRDSMYLLKEFGYKDFD